MYSFAKFFGPYIFEKKRKEKCKKRKNSRVGGDPYGVLGSAAGELTNGPVVVVLDQNWADAESVPNRQYHEL
jgi:hypothetical protein